MTDLERFFRQLVANLAASDPARLHHPIPLEDIQESIVPYRSNRRALHLDSSEDYEMVLLRLCAGEGKPVRESKPLPHARGRTPTQILSDVAPQSDSRAPREPSSRRMFAPRSGWR